MPKRLEILEAVATGRLSAEAGAITLGCSTTEVQRSLEVLELAKELSARDRRASRRRVLGAVAAAGLVGAMFVTRAALAAGSCQQTLPSPLVTFCPDEPALAAEVNGNFNTLATALVNKTGGITGTGITTAGSVSASSHTGGSFNGTSVTASQAINANGGIDFTNYGGQAINLLGGYGIGLQNSTTYFRTFGGFSWFGGGTHVGGNVDDPGAGGTRLMRLSSAGDLTVLTINGRRPTSVASNACSSGTCTASCGAGVVRQGWGFHGANFANNVTHTAGNCGTNMQWMGSCIGQGSCTVTASCGSSSIWLECW
jgi:hypothetical protein